MSNKQSQVSGKELAAEYTYEEESAKNSVFFSVHRSVCWLLVAFMVGSQVAGNAGPSSVRLLAMLWAIIGTMTVARFLLNEGVGARPGGFQTLLALGQLVEAWLITSIIAMMIMATGQGDDSPSISMWAAFIAAIAAGMHVRIPMSAPVAERDDSAQLLYQAVHEAGHALTIAMMGRVHAAGSYVALGGDHDLTTLTNVIFDTKQESFGYYKQWQMMLFLGGPVATEMFYGEVTDGSKSDMNAWRSRAVSYFESTRSVSWDANPETDSALARNYELLDEMRQYQESLLRSFFKENEEPYLQLVDLLIEKRAASEADLIGVFDAVVVPDQIMELVAPANKHTDA